MGNTWYFSCLPTQFYRVTSLHCAKLVHPIFRCSASATGSRPRRTLHRDGLAPAHARAESNGVFRFIGRRFSFALQVRNHLVPGVARWYTSVFIRFHRSSCARHAAPATTGYARPFCVGARWAVKNVHPEPEVDWFGTSAWAGATVWCHYCCPSVNSLVSMTPEPFGSGGGGRVTSWVPGSTHSTRRWRPSWF